jgi:hypothetical protein
LFQQQEAQQVLQYQPQPQQERQQVQQELHLRLDKQHFLKPSLLALLDQKQLQQVWQQKQV